jgi:hypothetical protein
VKDIDANVAPWELMDRRFLFGAALGDHGFSTSMVVITRNDIVQKGIWKNVDVTMSKTGTINTLLAYKEGFMLGTGKAGVLIYDKWWLERELEPLSTGLPKKDNSSEYIDVINLTKKDTVICAHLVNGTQYIFDYSTDTWIQPSTKIQIDTITWSSFICGMEHQKITNIKKTLPGNVSITESNRVFLLPADRIDTGNGTVASKSTLDPFKTRKLQNIVSEKCTYVYDLRGRLMGSKNIDTKKGMFLIVNTENKQFHIVKKLILFK